MQKYLQIAMNEQGTKEIKGQRDNPKIVHYFADVGHEWVKDDEHPMVCCICWLMPRKSGFNEHTSFKRSVIFKMGA